MLALIHDARAKKAAQAALEKNLKTALKREGRKNIGFPGGNFDQVVYSAGEEKLWCAFSYEPKEYAVPRYWNGFGIYNSARSAQTIVVEINIPTDSNSAMVAGFFAEDSETGDVFLMHSGRIGGGRPGIGKAAFLMWSKAKRVDVAGEDRNIRSGIAVGKLNDPDLSGRIWRFVGNVHSFKEEAAAGRLENPEFKRKVEEFERYSREFSGKKNGGRGGSFEYLTYHGDIVQELYDERSARAASGEQVLNSNLVDLYVRKGGHVTEVYEVKTGLGRQMLYTAIGQLVTHSAAGDGEIARFLVVPADEEIPDDFNHAILVLGIQVRRFRLAGSPSKREIKLVD
jgi:hypothetical protein